MINRRWIFPLMLFLITASLTAQVPEDWYSGKKIENISFSGLQIVSRNELNGIVRPYVGEIFTDSLSWDIQGKLYALEYFDLILPQVFPGTGEDLVRIDFQVKEKPVVRQILYKGNNRIRRGELRDTILLKKGDMVNNASIRMDALAIKNLYEEKGYMDAKVDSGVELDEESNSVVVTFTIDEGERTSIKEILFMGNEHVSTKTLKSLMKTRPRRFFGKGLLKENQLQEDILIIGNYYHERGYVDARVVDVLREEIRDEKDGSNKLLLTLVIQEGESYTYGGCSVKGNTLYSSGELLGMMNQVEGETFNQLRFQMAYQRLTDLYYENGYIYNSFDLEEKRNEEEKSISFIVNIVERDRAYLENIVIRGNDKTKTHVIARELPFEVGDVFSKKKVMEGVRNIHNTQFFAAVEPQTYPGSQEGLMDLVIDLEEGKTADILFGISFSGGQDFPVSGNIKWNDRNFFGSGKTVGLDSSFSPDTQSVSLQFSDPRLFDTRWGGGIDLTYRHQSDKSIFQDINGDGVVDPYLDNEDFENSSSIVPPDYLMDYSTHYISAGLNGGYTWSLGLGRISLFSGLRGGWEYVTYDSDVYRPWSEKIRENLETWRYHDSIWIKGALDTRDFIGNPSRGFILSETVTVAGLASVSSKHFMKTVSRGEVNFTLIDYPVSDNWNFKSVLSIKSAFSYLGKNPWDPIDVDPQNNGFYADGMFVARGWYPESDGQSLWDNTATLKFPIVPNIIAFDIFLDAVGLWKSKEHLKNACIQDMKFSLGAGFRFDNPQFPIGLYLVKKFNVREDGSVDWNPEPRYVEFHNGNLDLVISFGIDIY